MNLNDLKSQVALGEDSRRQFKRDVTNVDSLAAEMAAFSTSEGGVIYLGVADGGWPKWESFEHLGGLINRLDAFAKGTMPPPTIHPVPSPRRS